MTIPEYDKECDCEVCREDREIRNRKYKQMHAERERMKMRPQEVIEKFDNRLAELIGAVEETAVDGMLDRVNQAKYDALCYVRNEFRQLRKRMYPHSCIEREKEIRNKVLDELDKRAIHEAKTRSIKEGGLAFVSVQVWIEELQ